MNWGDEDELVKFLFLLAIPSKSASEHIDILMKISKKLWTQILETN